jgi:hypothetical protein
MLAMQVGREGTWKLFILQAEHGACFSGFSLVLGWFFSLLRRRRRLYLFCDSRNTWHTQKKGAVSNVIKRLFLILHGAQRTLSAAESDQVSHSLLHLELLDTHPHGNQTHPRLGVACPL